MDASSEGEVDAVPDDLEVWSLELVLPLRTRKADVGLLAHVSLDPVWLDGLLALVVYVLTSQHEAGAHIVVRLDR